MKKEILIILLLLFVSFPAVKSLFISGGFTSHDLTHHVIRQISMGKLLSEGQFPPRWSGELNNGFGYPLFLFNYPLPGLIGEIFHKLGLGFVDSVKGVLFTSMILSVLGMYLFLKELLGSKMAAFLGSLFYLYAPIRFLNVYVSAAVGSALALGIIPFVFWSLILISRGKRWAILVGALSLASLILAHNVTAIIFVPVLLIFVWILIREVRDIRVIREAGMMLLLGVGLSVWFWLPATYELQLIRFDQIFGTFYQDQFPTLWQLIRSPWGYGLSHPQNPESGDMSYQLGLIHLSVMVLLVPSLWFMRKIREVRVIGGFVLILFLVSVFLMLKISLPFWDSLPVLHLIQFPLRFQSVSIFSAAIATALLIKYLPYRKTLFISLLILVMYANRNHWNINQVFDPGEEYYLNLKTTSTSYGEHLPKWGRVMEKGAAAKLEFVKGEGSIKIVEEKSHKLLAQVETTNSAKLRFNQFYFPGWEIKVDGKITSFDYLVDGESYGLPIFDIEEGIHQIKAEFKNTTVRNIADSIALLSVIIWIGLLCKLLLRK